MRIRPVLFLMLIQAATSNVAHAVPLEKGIRSLAKKLASKAPKGDLSVAVLPLKTLDGQSSQFGGYVAERLITELHYLKGFKVVAWSAIKEELAKRKASGEPPDWKTSVLIGKALETDLIASGTYKDEKRGVDVAVNLAEVATGKVVGMGRVNIDADTAVRIMLARPEEAAAALRDGNTFSDHHPARAQSLELIYEDKCNQPDGTPAFSWDRDPRFKGYYLSSALKLTSEFEGPEGVLLYNNTFGPSIQDLVFEASMQKKSGLDQRYYGLRFRVADQSHEATGYFAGITGHGDYNIVKYVDKKVIVMRQGKDPNQVKKGEQENRLKVLCVGQRIEFYVNDNLITSVDDETYVSGVVGLGLESSLQVDAKDIRIYAVR